MVEEEEVEEIVREKRELPPEPEEVKETKDRAGAIWVLIGVGLEDGIPIEVSKVVFDYLILFSMFLLSLFHVTVHGCIRD